MGKNDGSGSSVNGSSLVNLSGDMMDDLAAGILDGGLLPEPTIADSDDYPAELQRIAFSLWAFEAGEDIRETIRLLEDRTGLKVNASTVRRWREVGSWSKISPIIHQTLSNASRSNVSRMSSLTIIRAQRWALNVFDDPTVSAGVKAKMFEAVMDRFGFPRLVRGEFFAGLGERGGELADYGDDELQEAWQAYSADTANATEPRQAEPSERAAYLAHSELMAGH